LLIVWYASIAVKALAAALLVRRRLHRFYPCLTALLAFSTAKSLLLAAVRPWSSFAYGWAWLIAEPLLALFLLAACWEALRRLTESYRNFARYAAVVFAGVLAMIVLGSLLVGSVPPTDYPGYVGWLMGGQKYVSVALALGIVFAVLMIPRYSTVPVRPTALRNCGVLMFYSTGLSIASVMLQSRATYYASGWVSVITGLAAACAWALLMTPRANWLPAPERISDEELRAAEERIRDLRNHRILLG
jgi:hypothetical protein